MAILSALIRVHFSDEHFTDLFVNEVTKQFIVSDEMHPYLTAVDL